MTLQMVMQITFFLMLIYGLAEAAVQPDPDCQKVCGNVSIRFPFGIGSNCYLDEWFAINCTIGSDGFPKAIISSINMEALEIILPLYYASSHSIFAGSSDNVRVKSPIISTNCSKMATGPIGVNITGSPFYFSGINRFTAVGCNNYATMTHTDTTIAGCTSNCTTSSQTILPYYNLQIFNASVKSNKDGEQGGEGCKMAFLADRDWLWSNNITDHPSSIQNRSFVPVVLNWRIYNWMNNSSALRNLIVEDTKKANCSNDSYGYGIFYGYESFRCYCEFGYEGNAYISTGCEDINECDNQGNDPQYYHLCPSSSDCKNTEGSYYCNRKNFVVIIGFSTSLGVLVFFIGAWWLYKVIKKQKEIKLKKKFFKMNGGLLLQQRLFSSEGNVKNTKIFNSNELEKATDNFNESRILGQGGQGTVYKGMLVDGRIVAIKKSIIVNEANLEQFINEVVILSQVNHRNVVKLLGCCLETEVPLLVYEFIPNGTLFQYLHDENEEFPLTWNVRLRIATEVARAVSYLHSAAALPIYHRDIKSKNILLDDKYRGKVADFGTSRLITIDQTHLTTLVHGTFGYLDPEYFQKNQFTEKSDVYSFGVVLVELLTGEKAIFSTRSQDGVTSLANYFILSFEENHIFDIIDARLMNEDNKGEIMAVANLANRCLNLSGKERPTMREVTTELEGIQKDHNVQQNYEEFEYGSTGEIELQEVVCALTRSDLESGIDSSSEVLPLLSFNTI